MRWIPICLVVLCAATAQETKISPLAGIWEGTLSVGVVKLRLSFHIQAGAGGALGGTFQSIDQGAADLPLTRATLDGDTVHIEIAKPAASLDGQLSADRSAIKGFFHQNGASLPLTLTRVEKPTVLSRPQVPQKPYPYTEEEVTVQNQPAAVTLAGTLTIPKGTGPFPAAILITGSGPQDRDESLMSHKPFLVIADHLTRHGIAVLRVDDRGTAKSTGNFSTATTADFATDVEAELAFLRSRKEIDPKHIGLIGHSEGGVIAPLVASRRGDVAFIVMLAGTGVNGEEVIVSQVGAMVAANRGTKEGIEMAEKMQRKILDVVVQEKDVTSAQGVIGGLIGPNNPAVKQLTSPWYRYFLAYDPAPALRKVRCPVLALNGDRDTQVVASLNLDPIRKALTEGGNKDFQVVELPGLNHLFQHATTGLVSEYGTIEETIAPSVLDLMTKWIAERAR